MIVGQGLELVLESKNPSGSWIVRPDAERNHHETTQALLQKHGQTPLPPYIRRGPRVATRSAYIPDSLCRSAQAQSPPRRLAFTLPKNSSSVSLSSNINWVDLVLHVGLGTFPPHQSSNNSKNMKCTPNGSNCRRRSPLSLSRGGLRAVESWRSERPRPESWKPRLPVEPCSLSRGKPICSSAQVTSFVGSTP